MAGRSDLLIEQGATFRKRWAWNTPGDPGTPVDLTGCTARMQIRAKVGAAVVLLELTTENTRIVLGGVDGTVDLIVSAVDTALIDWKAAVYDLEIVFADGITVKRLVYGTVKVSFEVTKP